MASTSSATAVVADEKHSAYSIGSVPTGALPQRTRKRRADRHADHPSAPEAKSEALDAGPEREPEACKPEADPAWAAADAPVQREYLDHTADVQLHSWGAALEVAFEQQAPIQSDCRASASAAPAQRERESLSAARPQVLAVFGLITDLDDVRVDPTQAREVVAEGHDMHSLLYNFLDEWLFQFNGAPPSQRCSEHARPALHACRGPPRAGEFFVCKRVAVLELDRDAFRIRSRGVGERFQLGRHEQGTEVKAITYSAMRITETAERTDVLTIVDI